MKRMKKRQGGKVLRSEREAVPLSDFLRGPGGEGGWVCVASWREMMGNTLPIKGNCSGDSCPDLP